MEYRGEMVTRAVADRRDRRYSAAGTDCYLFELPGSDLFLDSTVAGTIARFTVSARRAGCGWMGVDILLCVWERMDRLCASLGCTRPPLGCSKGKRVASSFGFTRTTPPRPPAGTSELSAPTLTRTPPTRSQPPTPAAASRAAEPLLHSITVH